MKLKRTMIFCLTVALIVVFSGCGVQLENLSSGEEDSSEVSVVEVTDADYEDTLEGLCDYFLAAGYVSGEKIDMQAQIIGASAGVKYTFAVNKVNVSVELYAFDLDALDAVGKETLESVKESGKFTVLGTEVNAVLSDNGKYLLIYVGEGDDEFTAAKEKAVEAFKAFKA